MRVVIHRFRSGERAREAKLAVYRYFRNTPRQHWHYYSNLDECSGTATFGGWFLSSAWTGRAHAGVRFPIWAWKFAARLKPVALSDRLITTMKRMAGVR